MEYDMIGIWVVMMALVSMVVLVLAYMGYKIFHERAVVEWMARHGIVEIEEEDEER